MSCQPNKTIKIIKTIWDWELENLKTSTIDPELIC